MARRSRPTTDQSADAAPHRIGKPTPLIQHLSTALAAVQHATLAAPLATERRFPWHSDLRAEAQALPEKPLPPEVAAEGVSRLSELMRGIEAWQRHPYRRPADTAAEIWSDGASRLLDFGSRDGAPVLIVPSLINRAYILDLLPGRSLVEDLSNAGYAPLLMDWGTPGAEERDFGLDDYLQQRLRPALAIARALARGPVPVIGYCMGGTLATALAARAAKDVSALVTIGTPWDFTHRVWASAALTQVWGQQQGMQARAVLAGLGHSFGAIPSDVFQTLFASLDPGLAFRKFRRFAKLEPADPDAILFTALEDWLNDGPPVPTQAATEILVDWHICNDTCAGRWEALGDTVDPSAITCPTLAFCAAQDRIAPPGSTTALPRSIAGAQIVRPDAGHVGMIVGRNRRAHVVDPLLAFLARVAND
ncbi:MAG: alpha/beta fold hydrolase [Pseudomonadota bacterium]